MTRPFAFVLAALACATALGCGTASSSAPPAREAELVLRSYDVPPGNTATDLGRVVASLLSRGDEQIGTARGIPGGRIAVLAPAGVHEGVESLLEGLATAGADAPAAIGMTYWLVRGRPGEVAPRPDDLRELEEPLSAIERAQGAVAFELLERLRIASVNNEHASVRGRFSTVRQVVSASGGTVVARVEVLSFSNQVEATVQAPPGRFIVLAEAGFNQSKGDAEETLYLIVRSSLGG